MRTENHSTFELRTSKIALQLFPLQHSSLFFKYLASTFVRKKIQDQGTKKKFEFRTDKPMKRRSSNGELFTNKYFPFDPQPAILYNKTNEHLSPNISLCFNSRPGAIEFRYGNPGPEKK